MRLYCYWPHPHREASALLLAALRPGDELVVEALPSMHGETFDAVAEYEVVRDLPDPTLGRSGLLGKARPLQVAWQRSSARRKLVRRGFDVGVIELLVHQTDWFDLRSIRRRMPLVSVVHDVRPHVSSLPAPIEDRMLRRLYAEDRAGHLIVFSSLLRDQLVADFGVDPARITVTPHALDGRDLRLDLDPPERPFVLFFGSLRANKGIDTLLDAIAMLPADPGFDVVVAGHGDARIEAKLLEAQAQHPCLRVELGFVPLDRKALLHSQASLVLLPYTSFSSFSGVLADAYSYRLPVLASDVGTIGDSLREYKTGWLVPPGDAAALAKSLTSVMASPGERDACRGRIGAAAAAHDDSVVGPMWRRACDLAVAAGPARMRSHVE
jgi:glycosyltransferase involved in cell wall biosynthesis